jgi:Ca2+-binding RTX toxin-like protein
MQSLEERVAQMPITRSRLTTIPLAAIAGAIASAALMLASPAGAKPTRADLRVVTGDGKTLVGVTQFTDTTKIPTSPKARCFFGGVGGSGDPATVEGPTPLGAVADAARSRKRLRPLLVTDEFSFGLGICGIGGAQADDSHFWNVRVNHVALQVGGDQFELDPSDKVLWALIANPVCEPNPPYACEPGPPELQVKAPARTEPGHPFTVRVFEWSDSGKRSAAAGATVTGAALPTDGSGETTVVLAKTRKLSARRLGAIASAEQSVCVAEPITRCPRLRGRILVGSGAAESIRGTRGGDRIRPGAGEDKVNARGGADLIRARGGGRDRIHCGSGNDTVVADRHDVILGGCEVVRR